MKALKRLCLRALLNKEQRTTILRSVAYSEYKYKKRGSKHSAAAVSSVRGELDYLLGEAERKKYTESQVKDIVEYYINDFYKWLKRNTKLSCVAVGAVVDKDKCAACEKRDDCVVNKALFSDEDDRGDAQGGESVANETGNVIVEHRGSCDTVGTLAAAAEVARKKSEGEKEDGDVNNV